jgi:DNA-binding NarL/FixJ family response regulator
MTQATLEFVELTEWESAAGSMGFAPQQSRIIALLAQGKEDKQIATQLKISYSTVRTCVSRAFQKSGATGRMELASLVFNRILSNRKTAEK